MDPHWNPDAKPKLGRRLARYEIALGAGVDEEGEWSLLADVDHHHMRCAESRDRASESGAAVESPLRVGTAELVNVDGARIAAGLAGEAGGAVAGGADPVPSNSAAIIDDLSIGVLLYDMSQA